MQERAAFQIGTSRVAAGARKTVNLPVSVLSDHTPVTLSVHVVHGRKPGPTLFVSAAVHGDEVMGVEVVRRLLRAPSLDRMAGTLMAVPIVNSFGFLNHSRYMPDRRDLNRSFPGNTGGSLAARLAHLFLSEVVMRADYGIDLHSAAIHRTNLPQIRVSPRKPETLLLAEAFGAPVIMTSKVREGSLRQTAQERGVEILLYEAGEGLRFDEVAVGTGLGGILRVMRHLGMVAPKGIPKRREPSLRSRSSVWLRAPAGGLFRPFRAVGDMVGAGEVIGMVSDPFGEIETEISADASGLLLGRCNLPVVNEGDALYHVAQIDRRDDEGRVIDIAAALGEEAPMYDEDEII